MQEPEILFEQRGCLGLITLNRPEALNALTYGMILAMSEQLDIWAEDSSIAVVAIQGAGDKAFAAGGDIRALYDAGQGGATGEKNFRFFADEYRLNVKIKRYPKPYVAIMDGIVMGGGVGVSIHGSHRFVTERTMFAMPETGIGLFPDVGATWFLPRMLTEHDRSEVAAFGLFCGLTGARLRDQDAATLLKASYLESQHLEKLVVWLATGPKELLEPRISTWRILALEEPSIDFAIDSRNHLLAASDVVHHFSKDSVGEIVSSLENCGTEWGVKQASTILSKSPTSTRIAFRQIREGAKLSFEDCMRLEYRLARYCMTHPDFYEGVRAVILDKDNAPQWSPASLDEATEEYVAEAFAHLGDEELDLT
ncbi:MAG: enoyl-CoA hydratase/isomerase family protein [Pseudomonadota bacterium]